MRIVDRATFLAMPAGTLFATYEPIVFGELRIKGETVGGVDFCVQQLIPWFTTTNDDGDWSDAWFKVQAGEPSPPLDYDCQGRDGCFDRLALFAVFEQADMDALIERLQQARIDAFGAHAGTPAEQAL